MISSSMLPQTCKIYRTTTDNAKSYVTTITELIAEYPCYLSHRSEPKQLQLNPQLSVTSYFNLFLNLPADILSGDIVEIDNESFTVGYVYQPFNRHIEADLYLEVEA